MKTFLEWKAYKLLEAEQLTEWNTCKLNPRIYQKGHQNWSSRLQPRDLWMVQEI